MTNWPAGPWLALDVGGANLKAAHQNGSVHSLPFAVWKHPHRLESALRELTASLPPFQSLALTMTAELCDCFRTKAEGVLLVVQSALSLAGSRPVRIWGTDGRFHQPEEITQNPQIAAASNWLALATFAARLVPKGRGLLLDIGSTTSDLIPLQDGRPIPEGRTDTDRLRTGELVYAGVRRTPVCALATHLAFRGRSTGLCAELFATTLDVYLILQDLREDSDDTDTADGRPATRPFARERLARMVGADRDDFSENDARELAQSAHEALMGRLTATVESLTRQIGTPEFAFVSGSGEWLAERVARRALPPGIPIFRLSERWSPQASEAACARALVELAQEPPG
ncbi:MAG TPA: hydantoinase/oxoprolinase family protein [Isosphaeraceae bacterium]|nr:hydantoinase/oxoprolinase family protein [Isosphaeraceae bacterium]